MARAYLQGQEQEQESECHDSLQQYHHGQCRQHHHHHHVRPADDAGVVRHPRSGR